MLRVTPDPAVVRGFAPPTGGYDASDRKRSFPPIAPTALIALMAPIALIAPIAPIALISQTDGTSQVLLDRNSFPTKRILQSSHVRLPFAWEGALRLS